VRNVSDCGFVLRGLVICAAWSGRWHRRQRAIPLALERFEGDGPLPLLPAHRQQFVA
jgi:hypothetical protein